MNATGPDEEPLARRLALGTLAQQGGQLVGVVVMLGVVTALGRTLSLAEFGVYGLVSTFATYLLFALGSAESAAVRDMAARDGGERDRVLSNALVVYAILGVVAGALIAGLGSLLLGAFDIPRSLHHEAQLGVLAVAGATVAGWPLKLFHDALRGLHRYHAAALAEASAYLVFGVAVAVVLALDGPLWILIGAGGALPLFIGASAAVVARLGAAPLHPRPSLVRRDDVATLLRVAGSLLVVGASDIVINSLDRAVLALFRPAATVGLYEGAVRPTSLVRQAHNSFGSVILPTASQLVADDDRAGVRELVVRGTRYMLAALVPLCVTFIVLGDHLLAEWLGAKFAAAHTALAIFVSALLLMPNATIAGQLMFVRGRLRLLVVVAWATALLNLALSLGLTPWLGLDGVALGTAMAAVAVAPFGAVSELAHWGIGLRDMARRVWLPVYGLGALLAALLLLARAVLDLDSLVAVAAVSAAGCLAYWCAFYALALAPPERALVRSVLPALPNPLSVVPEPPQRDTGQRGWRLGRRPALDGLRGVAVLLVIASHLAIPGLRNGGVSGVTLFFVLSGFLITSLLVEEAADRGSISLRAFYGRRVLRLYPALVVITVAVVAESVVHRLAPSLPLAGAPTADLPRIVLGSLFYVANWIRASGQGLGNLSHTWSLSIEEQFYLVWPALLILAGRHRGRLVAVVAVGILVPVALRFVLWHGESSREIVYFATYCRADAPFAGCLLALWLTAGRRFPTGVPVVVAAVVALVASTTPDGVTYTFTLAPAVAALAGVLLVGLVAQGFSPAVLRLRGLVDSGRISYGLYLWHIPIVAELEPHLAGRPFPLRWGIPVAVSYAVAYASFRLVEQPFLRRKSRLTRVRDEPEPAWPVLEEPAAAR